MVRIDAHQHYWQPRRGDYSWMPEDDPILARPYFPSDLAPLLEEHRIDRTVLVQAAPTVAETEYMLGLADACPTIAAVVGWVDFESPGAIEDLKRLSQHPKFVGVRAMIQDIEDVNWMLREDVQWAFEAIVELDLTFDCLGFPRHLENFHTILTRYPGMRAVLDHCQKPRIRDHSDEEFSHWCDGMKRLANDTNAVCKFSGLVTEATADWTTEHLRPYAEHVLTSFGPDRVMWGSDWPVCRLRAEYGSWLATANDLTSGLGARAQEAIFGGTAARFYRIG